MQDTQSNLETRQTDQTTAAEARKIAQQAENQRLGREYAKLAEQYASIAEAYNYDLGQKLLEEIYPDEACHGGIIDFVDCGELHNLLAKYHEAALTQIQQALDSAVKELKILKIAMGMHVNADAYGSTFPDNTDDAKYLKKQETYLRLSARNLISENLSWECHEAFKKYSEPELLEKLKELKLL